MLPSEPPQFYTENNKGPSLPWEYNFTGASLVEKIDNTSFVYGLWDKVYGFWEVYSPCDTFREFVPTWRLFDDSGIWLSQSETRDLDGLCLRNTFYSQWLFEADAAFAGLYSEIPRQIRTLVAPMGQHQGLALDLISHEPNLAHFIDEEFHNGREQHILSGLAMSRAEYWVRADRKKLARKILKNESSDLLSWLVEFNS
jgi:hypothetical protein